MENNENTERTGQAGPFKITEKTAALLECKRLLNAAQDRTNEALLSMFGQSSVNATQDELYKHFQGINEILNHALIVSIDDAMGMKEGEI